MYGFLLNQRFSPGVLGTVQRNDPEALENVIREKGTFGLDDLAKALSIAAEKGFTECVQILLRHNALPDIHDGSGTTPLTLASKRGHADIVKLLVNAGCNVNKPSKRVRATALHWAATYGHIDCISILLAAGCTIDARTSYRRTALMLASRSGEVEVVSELLEAGAAFDVADVEGCSALHLAAEEGSTECTKQLLKEGAKVNGQTKHGDVPLTLAVKRGHQSVVKILLQHSDIKPCPSSHGVSVLHWAAQGGYTQCLELLLPYQTDVNVQAEKCYLAPHSIINTGATPLMLASGGGHEESTEILLRFGADPEKVDVEGMTALLYAIKHDHRDSVRALLAHGANPGRVHMPVTEQPEDPEWAESISRSGSLPPEYPGEFRISPLFYALEKNSSGSCLELLRAGCNLYDFDESEDGQFLGPLEFALCKGNIKLCLMLMGLGRPLSLAMTPSVQQALGFLLEKDGSSFCQMMDSMSCPPLLSLQCRVVIRDALGQRVMSSVHKLPLPDPLKKFTDLEDLEVYANK